MNNLKRERDEEAGCFNFKRTHFFFFFVFSNQGLILGPCQYPRSCAPTPPLAQLLPWLIINWPLTGLGEGYVGAQLLRYWFWSLILIILVFSSNRVDSVESLTNVSTQTLKLHMSCVKGLHHHVPILFDYYHFAVIDTTIHATVTALGLPDHR